jgi:MFS transporter, DHA2 family, multidrug resistance protein
MWSFSKRIDPMTQAVAITAARAGRREWVGLAVIALPCVLYAMDLTVLDLAIPHISADLEPSSTQLLWILDIYGFLVAGSLITMGGLGDRFGRRRLLLIGAATFGLTSILAAFSRNSGMLIASRALLGLAGATLAPSTLSLIRNMFLHPIQRTFAIGVWGTSYSVGGAMGPLIGGLVLQHYWWGAVFLIGVPVMLLLLLLGPVLLPEFRDPAAGRLDILSAALSLAAVLLVIFGVKQLAESGWGWIPLVAVVSGVIVGWLFVERQRRLADPLIDLQLFHSPAFTTALAAYTLATFVGFGIYIYIAQYLQLVLGLPPFKAGLYTVPSMSAYVLGSMMVPLLARRLRRVYIMSGGLAIAAVGFVVLIVMEHHPSVAILIGGMLIYSLGLCPIFILATDLIVGSAPPERAGAAAALSETSSELGGALGIALLGSIGTSVYRGAMAAAIPIGIPMGVAEAARRTLGGAVSEAGRLGESSGAELLGVARESFVHAFTVTALICALISLATAVLVLMLLREEPAQLRIADSAAGSSPVSRRSPSGTSA